MNNILYNFIFVQIQFQLTYSLEQDEPRGIVTSYSSSSDIDKYPILNQEEARKVFQASFLKECRKLTNSINTILS